MKVLLLLSLVAVAMCYPQYDCTFDGEYIPDTTNCEIYYQCVNGRHVEFTCPAGTCFSLEASVCANTKHMPKV